MFLGPDTVRNQIPDLPFPNEGTPHYDENEKPLFIGHYWMNPKKGLNVLQRNLVCVDFSACKGGKMVAYRFDGEDTLDPGKFVAI